MITTHCIICKKEIKTYPSWIKSGKSKYCSRACQLPNTNKVLEENGKRSRFLKGQDAWNKKGFTFTQARKGGNKYKLLHKPEHPNCDRHGYVREHRYIFEQKIGRYLQKNEIIHHRDGNTLNNDIDNLELTNVSEHTTKHLLERWHGTPQNLVCK